MAVLRFPHGPFGAKKERPPDKPDKISRCPICRSVLVKHTDVNTEIMLICPKKGCSRQLHPIK